MPFIYADRVRETSASTGTGTFALAGAVSGFRTFASGIGANNTCYYAIVHRTASEWEVGYGTLDALGTTLTRTTVLYSSTGSAVSFTAGTKDVFVTIPSVALASFSTPNSTGSALQALTLSPHGASAGNTAEIRFLELAANGTNYVGFKAGDTLAGNQIWTLPTADGSSGTFLQTNGSGVTTWATVTTVGTVTSGTWNAGTIGILYGGTGATTKATAFNALTPMTTLGDTEYHDGTNGVRLAGNTTSTKQFLSQTGTGTVSAAPSWSTVSKSDVGLGSVENTALSTWAGSTNITTVGTIATGTWNASIIGLTKGGTNANLTAVNGGVAYSTASALALSAAGTANQVLVSNGAAAPTWASGLTLNAQSAVLINPYGASAGNTSELRFAELAANGTNYTGFKAADNIAANLVWTLPSSQGPVNAVLTNNGSGTLSWSQPPPDVMGGRLTITTNNPFQSNTISSSTLRYTPYSSNLLYLWTGSNWVPYFLNTDLTITNTAAGTSANTNYDVAINWNSGSPTLVLTAWSNSGAGTSTRATAITYQDLIPMVGSNRYIGTVRMDGSNVFADWYEERFVWNAYNRVAKMLYRDNNLGSTYTYASTTWRYSAGNATNIVKWITGLDGASYIDLKLHVGATSAGTVNYLGAIAMNAVDTAGPFYGGIRLGFCYCAPNTQNYMIAAFFGALEIGYNFGAWRERLSTAVSTTIYGNTDRSGIWGTIEC